MSGVSTYPSVRSKGGTYWIHHWEVEEEEEEGKEGEPQHLLQEEEAGVQRRMPSDFISTSATLANGEGTDLGDGCDPV